MLEVLHLICSQCWHCRMFMLGGITFDIQCEFLYAMSRTKTLGDWIPFSAWKASGPW